MEIELSNGKKVNVTGLDLVNKLVIFKWVDGVYGGDCSVPMEYAGALPTEEEITAALESELAQ